MNGFWFISLFYHSKICNVFVISACHHLVYIYLNKMIIKQYNNVIVNVIYCCKGKAECSASLLQSSVSHDPSEIIC